MAATVSHISCLLALPDEVLRVVARYWPLSELIVLVRCSWRFASVLSNLLSERLDGLFVLRQGFTSRRVLPFTLSWAELQALFGEGQFVGSTRSYYVAEAEGSNVRSIYYIILDSNHHDVDHIWTHWRLAFDPAYYLATENCFVGWLLRRHEQWLAAQHGE
jgi:hypothetical protein